MLAGSGGYSEYNPPCVPSTTVCTARLLLMLSFFSCVVSIADLLALQRTRSSLLSRPAVVALNRGFRRNRVCL
jgi:hypothetical protein